MAVFIMVMNFLTADRVYPKSLIAGFLGSSWVLLSIARLGLFRILLRLEKPPTAVAAVVLGTGVDGLEMAERLERDARLVCRVVGFVRVGVEKEEVSEGRVLGELSELPEIVNRHDVHMVVLAARGLAREEALKMAVLSDRMGLRVLQAPYSWGIVSPRLGFAKVGGLELIDLVGIRYPTLAEFFKRAFDLVAVVVGGGLILLPLLAIALAIKLQDGGPIFYLSKRVGRGGRIFNFYKFRSMVVNADKLRAELDAQNESDGRLFKMKNDPRITPFGKFIRKYSVDEFPQLINVLRGDMNLVGPRPLPASDLAGIESDPEMSYWFEQRHKVNPGITGLWQVSGRSSLGFADMVRLDIQYIQDWSFWLDLQILAKTLPAVMKGRGAM
jgi:exopolysaccharide biosynthesis polyprenyl glycosylphosphotransferase